MLCGVLALQGDWAAHARVLNAMGVETTLVRTAAELAAVDALVLPGGESTAMLRLMEPENLADKISQRVRDGLPVLATCAGVILLAEHTTPDQPCLGLLDLDIERNAYGRQVHSRVAAIELAPEMGEPRTLEAVFIRAPRMTRTGPGVQVLGTLGDDPVLVRQNRIVAATFHPELTDERRVHHLWVGGEEHHGR